MGGEILLALLLLLWLIGGPIIALVQASLAKTQARKTQADLRDLETELRGLRQELWQLRNSGAPQEPMPQAEIPDQAAFGRPVRNDRTSSLVSASGGPRHFVTSSFRHFVTSCSCEALPQERTGRSRTSFT